jgi:pimeloyl-ACP methyl ester carboxylesterase
MATNGTTSRSGARRRLSILVAAAGLLVAAVPVGSAADSSALVRTWTIHYRAHNGADRLAAVVLPAWYGPENHPSLPVIISPHGRNGTGVSNSKYFSDLPAVGRFALISPDGMGHRLRLKSYAYRGQIDDLAAMPELATRALPWLHVDRSRIYAVGSSMGGHETLMLVARHPRLLAGAVAMDSVTDLARRYHQLTDVPCDTACLERWGKHYGLVLQDAMRREVGGTPEQVPGAYAARSPLSNARSIAFSHVPLQIWWSVDDRIVTDQRHQSGTLFRTLQRLNECAPVAAYVGHWPHSKEMRAEELLPIALGSLGLLDADAKLLPKSVRHQPAPTCGIQP